MLSLEESKTHVYYKRYSYHSKAVGICWGLLTLCFLVINIICFVEPQWLVDSEVSSGRGWMGLYEYCEIYNSGQNQICMGQFQDFGTILSPAFRASTWFIGVSVLLIFLVIFLFILFFFKTVYKYAYFICGSVQALSTVFMFLGCVIYPAGWDHAMVARLCGGSIDRYNIGNCSFGWAYVLAIVGIGVIFMITCLAFTLAVRTNQKLRKFEEKSTINIGSSKPGSIIGPPYNQHGTMQSAVPSGRSNGGKPHMSEQMMYPGYETDDTLKGRRNLLSTDDYGRKTPTHGYGRGM